MSTDIVSFREKVSALLNRAADLLFPYACFGCGASATWLCSRCQAKVPILPCQRCFHCQKNPTRYGEACYECAPKRHSPLDAVFSATCYDVPVIKRMLHAYKYHFVESVSMPLGALFSQAVEKSNLPLATFIVPVPLHPKRLRYRGFNQSALLSEFLIKNIDALNAVVMRPALFRARYTKPQQRTTSKEERGENLKDAFIVSADVDLRNQIIWLIDDITTTHSTAAECARVLKKAGAKKVYSVNLAIAS